MRLEHGDECERNRRYEEQDRQKVYVVGFVVRIDKLRRYGDRCEEHRDRSHEDPAVLDPHGDVLLKELAFLSDTVQ